MGLVKQLDKDTLFIAGENNALIWEKTAFDPSVDIEHFEDKKIERVYISHGHADHFRQASYLREKGAKILTAKKESVFVEDPTMNVRAMFSWAALPPKMVTRFFRGEGCKVDGYTEDDIDSSIISIPLPGHSVGHLGFLLPNKVLFSGDALWPKELWDIFPFPYTIDINQARNSLKKIKTLDFEWLIPAHGSLLSHSESLENIDYHLKRLDMIDEMILNFLSSPLKTEELAESLSKQLNLINRLNQYWLTIVILKGFLCSLYERGLISCEYDEYQAKWVKE